MAKDGNIIKFSFKNYDQQHRMMVENYVRMVEAMFDKSTNDIAQLTAKLKTDGIFAFKDYPQLYSEVQDILQKLAYSVSTCISLASEKEWLAACKKNDAFIDAIFDTTKISKERLEQLHDRNLDALKTYQKRKIDGMNLSQRVWKYVGQYKDQIEQGLDVGLGEGRSAAQLARDLKQNLREPDRLFRRVRNKRGNLVLSKNAKAYHPGRGVYRSSVKNAQRLTRSETNMAYRESDQLRWQTEDFVVGYEIHRSTHEPLCKCKLCERLVGKYPKWFKFKGWHPQCMCYVTPILGDDETFNENELGDLKAALRGTTYQHKAPKNMINDVPDEFKKWVDENIGNQEDWASTPYFIKDNFVDGDLSKGLVGEPEPAKLTPLQIAEKRHAARTPEYENAIKQAWEERQKKNALIKKAAGNVLNVAQDYGEVDFSELQSAINTGNLAKMQIATKAVAQAVSAMKKQESALSDLIPNVHSLHQSHSMKELSMVYKELDGVMKKWLAKYGYSSFDAAPLQHLKNKLDFELTNPSVSYSNQELIKKAIIEKIKIIDKQIEWNDLVAKGQSLKTFVTKSPIYKAVLTKIDAAILSNDANALRNAINEAEVKRQELIEKQLKKNGNSALNKEYKGSATGKDLTLTIDTTKMVSEDPYAGTFTNNIARMQGFDSPAKLVSDNEFEMLAKASGDVFYRTVNPTTFKGKKMSSKEFASQLYVADKLELNGPGGRVYGDGMYVATSAWNGHKILALSDGERKRAYSSSISYGKGNHTITEMTWVRKPRIIKQSELKNMWRKLTPKQRRNFGNHENTYACALGYDGMYCDGPNYMVIWNRSIIAVKNK